MPDGKPEFDRALGEQIRKVRERAGVTPLGIDRPPTYPLWRAADERNFGKDGDLACGYLDASDEHAPISVAGARAAEIAGAPKIAKTFGGTSKFFPGARQMIANLGATKFLREQLMGDFDIPVEVTVTVDGSRLTASISTPPGMLSAEASSTRVPEAVNTSAGRMAVPDTVAPVSRLNRRGPQPSPAS